MTAVNPFVIPVFISHQGCPHRCIFCDQHTITGSRAPENRPVDPATVQKTVSHWLRLPRKTGNREVQVAFYGGSFTGLPGDYQVELLDAVQPYVRQGLVNCIRVSTRPDYINDETIGVLKQHGVAVVELGIQSLEPDVLAASARGHSVRQSEDAVRMLRKNGFIVGAQLMCGLPRDRTSTVMATTRKTARLGPDFVRIYPTLVIKGSGLDTMYREGRYRPLSLPEAVVISSRMKAVFDDCGIRVVRMGLQPSRELAEKVAAGPYHPSFGELVRSRSLFNKARKALRQAGSGNVKKLSVAAADESIFRGPGNVSMKRLTALGLMDNLDLVFSRDQARDTVRVY